MISVKKLSEYFLIIAILLSNISQIPSLFGNPILKYSYTLMWILLMVIILYINNFKNTNRHIILTIILDKICIAGCVFGQTYISSALFIPINMSVFIMIIGILFGAIVDDKVLSRIAIAYIVSSLVVGINLYLTVFRGVDWSGATFYLYGSKNSAAQFLLVGLILVTILFYEKSRIVSLPLIGFYVLLIIMMKSRTTLVALAVYLLYFVIFIVKSRQEKLVYISLMIIFVLLVIYNPEVNNFIIKQIMFNNKATDITTLSSGRDAHWIRFATEFPDYMFFGTGGTYLESMPLAVLMSYGLIGGIPILLFSLKPLLYSLRCFREVKNNVYIVLVISISIIMLINSFFEEQAPFGPGVKCYFLWLVFGMLIGKRESNSESEYYEEYKNY